MSNKPKLNASDTVIFLSTKNNPHKDYDNNKYSWKKGTQEEILTDYSILINTFVELTGIENKYLTLEIINSKLIDILEKINPKKLKAVLLDSQSYRFVESTGYGVREFRASHSPAQAIFLSVYGHLQAIQVYKGKEELIDMDESLCKK